MWCAPLWAFSGHRDIWAGWPPILALGSLLPDWPRAASCLPLPCQESVLLLSGLVLPLFTTPLNTSRKLHDTRVRTIYLEHIYTVVNWWESLRGDKGPAMISLGESIVYRITHKLKSYVLCLDPMRCSSVGDSLLSPTSASQGLRGTLQTGSVSPKAYPHSS